MGIVISYGDYTFNDSKDVEAWDETSNVRIELGTFSNRDGAFIVDPPSLDVRRISIKGSIVEDTEEETKAALKLLTKALKNPNADNTQAKRLSLWDNLYVNAVLESFHWEIIEGTAGLGISYDIGFVCYDPYYYSKDIIIKESSIAAITANVFGNGGGCEDPSQWTPFTSPVTVGGVSASASIYKTNVQKIAGDWALAFGYSGVVVEGKDKFISNFGMYSASIDPVDLSDGKDVSVYVWMNSKGQLDQLDYIRVRAGSSSANYYYYDVPASRLQKGWNLISFNPVIEGTQVGTPNLVAVSYLYIEFVFLTAIALSLAEPIIIDQWIYSGGARTLVDACDSVSNWSTSGRTTPVLSAQATPKVQGNYSLTFSQVSFSGLGGYNYFLAIKQYSPVIDLTSKVLGVYIRIKDVLVLNSIANFRILLFDSAGGYGIKELSKNIDYAVIDQDISSGFLGIFINPVTDLTIPDSFNLTLFNEIRFSFLETPSNGASYTYLNNDINFDYIFTQSLINEKYTFWQNIGDSPIYPIYTITALGDWASGWTLNNLTTGRALKVNKALVANDVVEIDTSRVTFKLNGASIFLDIDTSSTFALWLASGGNDLRIIPFSGSVVGKLKVAYIPRFYL